MLKLDKLELVGFKSFADKTRIVFPDRITGIIGPNGCGKSNLSDAIGWVLGLQGARNLRGQKMDDVIFGGTRKRKQSGYAEVRISLRNTDPGALRLNGTEINDPEIEIRRRLERSGESHYYINRKRCRLMDIHKLLEEGGLGFASYAMIAQGRIESFLNAKPLDRRNLIEEAAQILGYKSKRKNAELKLEMAQQNLLRVTDIITEVERQLRSLKRQANKAARYKKLKKEFKEVQKQRLAVEADRLKRLLSNTQDKVSALKKREAELHINLEEKEKLFRDTARKRDHLQEELSQLREQLSNIHLGIDRCENSIRHNRQQIGQYREAIESSRLEQEHLAGALEKISEETQQLEQVRRELEEEEGRTREELLQRRIRVEEAETRVRQVEDQLEELRNRQVRLSAEEASMRNLLEQLNHRLKRSVAETDRVSEERGRAAAELSQARVLYRKRQEMQTSLEAEVRKLKNRLLEEEQALRELEAQREELRGLEKDLENRLVGFRERLQSLEEIEMSRSHYSEGVQNVLTHIEKSRSLETPGTLADSIETSPEYERLVEEFLGEELEYILVDTMDDALRGVPEVRSLKSGKCTFFSIHSTNGFGKRISGGGDGALPGPSEGVYGRIRDLLQMDPEVEAAFHRVLPDRAEAIVVSDIDRAMVLAHSHPQGTFITLQGETLTPQGLLSVSTLGASKLGLLGLKRQKREIEKKMKACAKEFKRVAGEIKRVEGGLADAQDRVQQSGRRLIEAEKSLVGAIHSVEEIEREVRRQKQALRVFEFELEKLEAEGQDLLQKRQASDAKLHEVGEDLKSVENRLGTGREQVHNLRETLEAAQSEFNRVASQMNILKERKQSLRGTLERIAQQKSSLEEQIDSISDRVRMNRTRIEELEKSITDSEHSLEMNRTRKAEVREKVEESQGLLEVSQEQISALETRIENLRMKKSALREERSGTEIERARFETQLQSLEDQCRESLQIPLNLAVSGIEIDQIDREFVRQRYEELRKRLDSFGPINMTALTEYQENEERHRFLTGQKSDIETSIEDTICMIQEINRRSTRQFREAFEIVNENFKAVFQQLFGGGDCGMRLLDEEDILECGIDVYAQPPGKRLQNVMLLSGGEKALTVFALLVGIFMYRPSGFCLLDEVDAPLDDANVKRFGELVRTLSERTQFVLITHNKRTMEIADNLYGITMEEAGVSKVYSVQF